MALKPLASDLRFVLADAEDPGSVRWDAVAGVLEQADDVLLYGFTSILWPAWGQAKTKSAQRSLEFIVM